eukprot:1830969-Prymnesium_polylepis.1
MFEKFSAAPYLHDSAVHFFCPVLEHELLPMLNEPLLNLGASLDASSAYLHLGTDHSMAYPLHRDFHILTSALYQVSGEKHVWVVGERFAELAAPSIGPMFGAALIGEAADEADDAF